MTVDTRTICLIWRRISDLEERPPLFHDGITPRTIRARARRIMSWQGAATRSMVRECLVRQTLPEPGFGLHRLRQYVWGSAR